MVRVKFEICVPYESIMDDSNPQSLINLPSLPDTLQDIAYNIVQDKLNSSQSHSGNDNHTKERTIFVLGSKGVVKKSDIIHCVCFPFIFAPFYWRCRRHENEYVNNNDGACRVLILGFFLFLLCVFVPTGKNIDNKQFFGSDGCVETNACTGIFVWSTKCWPAGNTKANL